MALHTLRLLHISDIHMRGGREKEGWRRREVLGPAWQKNIDVLLLDGPIDLICLTGDIGNTGQPDEYEDATVFVEELLKRVGQPMQRLFVVPGNHDIDRGLAKRAWNALRKYLPGTDPLDTSRWLAGGRLPTTRGLSAKHLDDVFLRQRAYQEWITKTLGRPELLPGKSPHGRLGYRVKLDIPSLPFPVFLIGLDSAWLAGNDSDAENLRLTEDQIMRLAADKSGSPLPGLRLALVHHPLHSLADHTDSRQRLAKHVDLLLRGHLHREDTSNELRPDGALFQIAAGCLYEGSKANAYPNSCQVLTLTLNEQGKLQRFELRFRTWSSRGHWHDDPGRYANAPRGRLACVRHNTAEGESWQFGPADENQARPPAGPATANPEHNRVSVGLESVLDGLRTLPAGPQVRKFLDTYLGTREHPEPFGGRTKELQELRRWFDALSPPSMVVSAPAGSGKSALLCRFCEEITKRSDVAVVYFPISIRYQTSLENRCIPALVSRLCHLHREAAPKLEHTSPEQWRLLLDQYLTRSLPDGRTLLLVLDGLDETTGWQVDRTLLPVQPAARVRILVAARTRVGEVGFEGWRQNLGWTSPAISTGMSLSGLDVDGVAEAISSLGMPLDRVAQRSELVVQIHRLSRGEPLLVQLWCHRLWQDKDRALTLTPTQLEAYPPGLKGYLQEFWEARNPEEKSALHERKTAHLLLEILASALGPLSREDLLALIPEIRSVTEMKEALAPLARFVEGNGLEQGYVLRHSLLRDHFREEEMTKGQREERDARFLQYGEQTLADLTAGRLQPETVSVYLLQSLGSHIQDATNQEEARQLEQQLALVSNLWRLAWERQENGVGGFLYDVERAWESVTNADLRRVESGQPSQYLPAIVRCAVCVAAQRTRTHDIYYRLFERLVEQGIWSVRQALAYVQQMSGGAHPSSSRKTLFAFLIPRLPNDLLRRALDIALEMVNAQFPDGRALFALWERLANVCRHEAINAVYQITEPYERIAHLAALAQHLPGDQAARLYDEASRVAHDYSDAGALAATLERLADHLPERERAPLLQESTETALRIALPAQRAFRLLSLLPKLPQRLRETALDAMLDAALPLSEDHYGSSLLDAIGSFPESTQHRVVHRIWLDPKGPAAILHWLTNSFHPASEQAKDLLAQRWELFVGSVGVKPLEPVIHAKIVEQASCNAAEAQNLLVKLAPHLSSEFLKDALALLRQNAHPWVLAGALCLVGHYISSSETIEGLHLLFRLEWPTDGAHQFELLSAFSHLSEPERAQALTIVAEATQPQAKAWASYWLAYVFTGLQQQQLLEQAASAALLIPSAKHKADLLLQLWPHFPMKQRQLLLNAGLEVLDAMRSTWHKIRRVQQLASTIDQPYCDQRLRAALAEVPRLESGYRHGAVLQDLLQTSGISAELKDEIWRQALQAIRTSKPVYAPDLTDLSEHAPPGQQSELLLEALDATRILHLRNGFLQTAFVLRPSVECQRQLLRLSEQLASNAQLTLFCHYAWPNIDESLQPELTRRELLAIGSLPEQDIARLTDRANMLERVPVPDREALAKETFAVAREFLERHHEFLNQVPGAKDDDINRDEVRLSEALRATLPRLFEHRLAMADAVALVPLIPQAWHESQAAALQLFDEVERAQRLDSLKAQLRALTDEELSLNLTQVAIRLRGDERTQGIAEALSKAIPRGSSALDYRGLWLVAPHLEASHLDSFMDLLVTCLQGGHFGPNLSQLVGRLPARFHGTVVERLLGAMTAWQTHLQDQVLVACAPYLGSEWHDRVAAALPRVAQPQMIEAIGSFATEATDRVLWAAFSALETANGTLAPTDGQAAALAIVGAELLRRKPAVVGKIWPVVLRILRSSPENVQRLTQMLRNLAPILRAAVGVEMIDKLVEALLELSGWWEES